MTNPYMDRRAQHALGKGGRASEKKLAQRLGARATPASGAMAGAKGDMQLNRFLLEAKATQRDTMILKREWLAKISHEARSKGQTPALSVTFITPDGTPVINGRWVLIPEYEFDAIINQGG